MVADHLKIQATTRLGMRVYPAYKSMGAPVCDAAIQQVCYWLIADAIRAAYVARHPTDIAVVWSRGR